jgi:glycosyltransferase involved in cell wall biosynthesis
MARTIAMNIEITKGPFGGGNQWARMMARFLKCNKYKVTNKLKGKIDLIIMVDPRETKPFTFGIDDIVKYKTANNNVVILHRINECDKRKNTRYMDKMLKEANRYADFTVFVSNWLFAYHAKRWFDKKLAYKVINNAADNQIFNPFGREWGNRKKQLKLVTHHWSDNWNKGFRLYQEVDNLIEKKIIKNVELHIVGRWPNAIVWKTAHCVKPIAGIKLANYLKMCDLYITGSLYDPCGMHQVEAAQCGLPIIYTEDGGGNVEMASRYGVPLGDDIPKAINMAIENYAELCLNLIRNMPSSVSMLNAYALIIEKLLTIKLLTNKSNYSRALKDLGD